MFYLFSLPPAIAIVGRGDRFITTPLPYNWGEGKGKHLSMFNFFPFVLKIKNNN
jgi:hypothetical protein